MPGSRLRLMRMYEKKGLQLEAAGITMEKLDSMADEVEISIPEQG